jgi:serine/threonine protein kinase
LSFEGLVDLSATRILITDDDETIRETLHETLVSLGCRHVKLAEDGEEALKALSDEKFDLLLLDLAMPKLRGEEVVEVALGQDPGLIIIVITGYATLEKAVSLMKKGIYDLLRKPFNPYTLVRKVESALIKHRARKEDEGKPQDFGEFELLEEISRGGVGVVWRALDKTDGEVVALKILLAGKKATDEQVIRFHREASTVAELRHPHIVSIRRIGAHVGQHFIAMDLIDGQPMDEWIEYNDPPLRVVLRAFVETGLAVHYAHEREIVHRDLKPSNILVDERNLPHIIDFGLATSIREDLRITEKHRLHGTMGFIAPERFSDRGKTVDLRADIFSLGVMLYEVLTGTFPYRMLKNVDFLPDFNQPPAPPSDFRPELPPGLSEAALKAVAIQAEDRFQSAREFMEAVRACMEDMH